MPRKKRNADMSRKSLWISRFVFLALSAFLWFLLKMSNTNLHADVKVPIQLIDQPEDLMLVNPPRELQVQVSAPGIFAIRESWREQSEIELSFEDFNSARNGRYYLTREQFVEEYRSYIPSGVEWRTKQDTIWIETSALQRKRVALVAQSDFTFVAPNYAYGKPQLQPDSIYLFGPSDYLDTVTSFTLPTLSRSNVEGDVHDVITLNLPANLHSPVSEVEFLQRVKPFTEKWLDVALQAPDAHFGVKSIPAKVQVRCRVAVEDYDRLHAGLVKATYEPMKKGDGVVPVQWEHVPEFVEIVEWKPSYIEVVEDSSL